jgi:hypothetical protein
MQSSAVQGLAWPLATGAETTCNSAAAHDATAAAAAALSATFAMGLLPSAFHGSAQMYEQDPNLVARPCNVASCAAPYPHPQAQAQAPLMPQLVPAQLLADEERARKTAEAEVRRLKQELQDMLRENALSGDAREKALL